MFRLRQEPPDKNPPRYLRGLLSLSSHILHIFPGFSISYLDQSQPAVDVINTLTAAQAAGQLKNGLKTYLRPSVLILDELGYLPIDKHGGNLLFQVISCRYEKGSIVITSNRAYKHCPEFFNNDATLTSAILDRLLHHAYTVVTEGKSYRIKQQVEV